MTDSPPPDSDFTRSSEQPDPGLVAEFLQFLSESRKWWLIPIVLAMGLIALAVALSASPLAPLIYPLF